MNEVNGVAKPIEKAVESIPGHEAGLKALTTCIVELVTGTSKMRFFEAQKLVTHSLGLLEDDIQALEGFLAKRRAARSLEIL